MHYVLALLMVLVPSRHWRTQTARLNFFSRAIPSAEVIAMISADPEEAAVMSAIQYRETRLGRGIPFGVSSVWQAGMPLAVAGKYAMMIWLRSAMCGRSLVRRLSFYNSGRCEENAYGRLLSGWVPRMMRESRALMDIASVVPARNQVPRFK